MSLKINQTLKNFINKLMRALLKAKTKQNKTKGS